MRLTHTARLHSIRAHIVRSLCVLFALSAMCVFAQTTAPPAPIDAERVRALATASLAEEGSATGIVVGWMEGDTPQFVSVGVERKDGAAMSPRSHFEVGSITKALTGSLLGVLERRKVVALTDPVEKWIKELNGSACGRIRLEQLATHTSGLPRLPTFFSVFDALKDDPYAQMTREHVVSDCARWNPSADKPIKSEYSNYGFGLLGLVLERATQTPYETLIRRELLAPIGIADKEVTFSHVDPDSALLAQGYGMTGSAVPYWHIKSLHAAGAAVMSAETLLRIAHAAQRGMPPFDAGAAQVRFRGADAIGTPPSAADMIASPQTIEGLNQTMAQGLGWVTHTAHGDWIVWHNGGTGGFRSMLAFSRVSGRTMIALANGHNETKHIVLHLLNEKYDSKPAKSSSNTSALFRYVFFFVAAYLIFQLGTYAFLARQLRAGAPITNRFLKYLHKRFPVTPMEFALTVLFFGMFTALVAMAELWPPGAMRYAFGLLTTTGLIGFAFYWQPGVDARTATKRRWNIFNLLIGLAVCAGVLYSRLF